MSVQGPLLNMSAAMEENPAPLAALLQPFTIDRI